MTYRGSPEEIAALKIGDTLWHFDGNRREYRKGDKFGGSGPIYSKHFAPYRIVGETERSWLVGEHGKVKVNKKTLESAVQYSLAARGYFTESAMQDDIWSHAHRPHIINLVRRCTPEQLRQIAAIVGYDPEEQK